MRKRTVLDCNSVRFASFLEEKAQCTHERTDHQVIEGATCVHGQWVNRSLLAGMWTKELCLHIVEAAEKTLCGNSDPSVPPVMFSSIDDPDLPAESRACEACSDQPTACCLHCIACVCVNHVPSTMFAP